MSWRKVKIGEFLSERTDRFSPDQANKLGLKRVGKIDFSGKVHLVTDKSTKTGMILVKKGDLLISGINAEKGAVSIYDFEEDALATIHYSSYTYDASMINIAFLKWFLKSSSFKGILNSNVGSGIKTEIKPKRFLALEMYLPELEEQETIVNYIQAVEGEIEELQKFSNNNISLVSVLRQAVLTEAVTGQLTAQWRKENPNQEPASELLKRIAAEKEQLIKEKKISKEKPLPPIKKEEVPYDLPEGWEWCRLGNLGFIQGGGTPSKGNMSFWNGEIPWVSPKDMKKNVIFDTIDKITLHAIKESSAKLIEKGSVLFVVRGMILIHTFPVAISGVPLALNQDMKAISLYNNKTTEFVYTTLKGFSKQILSMVERASHGTCKLNSEVYYNFLIPIPPLFEQLAIVKTVNKLLAYCDELKQQTQQSKADLESLMESILSEVFGIENRAISNKVAETDQSKGETLVPNKIIQTIDEGNSLNMELLEILQQQGGKIAALNLWKLSKYQKDIDAFYAALKKEVEEKKTIKESAEKGWLELVEK